MVIVKKHATAADSGIYTVIARGTGTYQGVITGPVTIVINIPKATQIKGNFSYSPESVSVPTGIGGDFYSSFLGWAGNRTNRYVRYHSRSNWYFY